MGKKVTRYDEIFMQILRSQRMSTRAVAKKTGFSKGTVERYTENASFPKFDKHDISRVLEQVLFKNLLEAYTDDDPEHARRHAQILRNNVAALKEYEELRLCVSLKDTIMVLERAIKAVVENSRKNPLDVLQGMYDSALKELTE